VFNLSSKPFSHAALTTLNLGHKFIPTPGADTPRDRLNLVCLKPYYCTTALCTLCLGLRPWQYSTSTIGSSWVGWLALCGPLAAAGGVKMT
jgi:hypothetical protein